MIQRIRLVIVDDHAMMRETWKMVLQRDPRFEVVAECASGAEAISCADSVAVDVMLMDINMTPVNGFEATRKILKAHPEIKIIGLSINNQPTYARNMMQLGAKGYVTKNSPSAELMEAIVIVHSGRAYICKELEEKMKNQGT